MCAAQGTENVRSPLPVVFILFFYACRGNSPGNFFCTDRGMNPAGHRAGKLLCRESRSRPPEYSAEKSPESGGIARFFLQILSVVKTWYQEEAVGTVLLRDDGSEQTRRMESYITAAEKQPSVRILGAEQSCKSGRRPCSARLPAAFLWDCVFREGILSSECRKNETHRSKGFHNL